MSTIAEKRQKIKIVYILTPIDFGGAEKVSLNFLKSFDRDKFKIVPILLLRPWEKQNYFENEIKKFGIEYLSIPVAIKPLKEGRDYFRILRCYWLLFSILRGGRFDAIHTNGYFADILGVPLAKLFRIPHLSTCHGFINNDRSLRLYNKIDISLLKFSDKIISVAADIKDKLVSLGISENKILTIINAVLLPDLRNNKVLKIRISAREKFNIANGEIAIGYIGRLSEEKGLKHLLKAGKELKQNGATFKIILIGDGPQRLILEDLTKNLGIQNHCVFAGFQKNIDNLIPALDVFVLPSLTEGTPMALLEAMSYGIPVVATAVGGIPKVIRDGENGILISPSKSSEITSSVLELSRDQKYASKLSNAARNSIHKYYNLNNQVKKVESLYLDLITKKRRRV